MRFAYHATMCNPAEYLDLARKAEELHYDCFTLPDSICYPEVADTKYPYNADGSRNFLEGTPFLEPFSAIPAMSAVTEKLTFSTSVVKLPIRHPVLLAKQLSTIAVLNNNRLVLGAGLSPWIEDFQICGERWKGRGKRMDQMIEIIRGLMTGEYFAYDSEFYQIDSCKICPVPTQQVPILVGGHAEPALKRAARIGDGWIHAGGDYDSLKPLIEKINQYREEYGTADKPFQIHAITGDAYSLDGIKRLEEIGVTECIVGFRNSYENEPEKPYDEKIAIMEWYANEIIAKSR